MLNKLELKWFESYLSNRKQCTLVNRCLSEMAPIEVGVPQGAILSVILFKIFINSMPKCLKFSSAILYADDTTIYLIGKSFKFLRMKVQSDLDSMSVWLQSNGLKLNVKKTKCMVLNNADLLLDPSLEVDGQPIEVVSEFKFLGIYIDTKLNFVPHFTHIHDKLIKSSYIVRQLGKLLPYDCMKTLYYAYFYSHLTYGLSIWWPLLKKSAQNSVFMLQKRIVRCVTKPRFLDHCMPLFKKLCTLTVNDQASLDSLNLMFRINQDTCPKPICNLFPRNDSTYNTRGLKNSSR